MNLYCLVRRLLPGVFADICYTLLCALAIILIFMFWPTTTNIFAYLRL